MMYQSWSARGYCGAWVAVLAVLAGCAGSLTSSRTELPGKAELLVADVAVDADGQYVLRYGDGRQAPMDQAQAIYWYQQGQHPEHPRNTPPVLNFPH